MAQTSKILQLLDCLVSFHLKVDWWQTSSIRQKLNPNSPISITSISKSETVYLVYRGVPLCNLLEDLALPTNTFVCGSGVLLEASAFLDLACDRSLSLLVENEVYLSRM